MKTCAFPNSVSKHHYEPREHSRQECSRVVCVPYPSERTDRAIRHFYKASEAIADSIEKPMHRQQGYHSSLSVGEPATQGYQPSHCEARTQDEVESGRAVRVVKRQHAECGSDADP